MMTTSANTLPEKQMAKATKSERNIVELFFAAKMKG
jgi:hypothetical protein